MLHLHNFNVCLFLKAGYVYARMTEEDFNKTIYQTSYVWKSGPLDSSDGIYEEIVRCKISGEDPPSSPRAQRTVQKRDDPYELLVAQKINQVEGLQLGDTEGDECLAQDCTVEPRQIKPPEPYPQEELEDSESSATHTKPIKKAAIKKKSKAVPGCVSKNLFNPTKVERRSPGAESVSSKKSAVAVNRNNFLSASVATVAPKARVVMHRPRFYRHPEEAPEDERSNLHGPFWVYWPNNKPIPRKYRELGDIINRNY